MGINRPVIKVKDLRPIHSPATAGDSGTGEKLVSMTDEELLATVTRPLSGERLVVDPATGRVFQGNARAYELLRRAVDPSSSIMPDTEVPYDAYAPGKLP